MQRLSTTTRASLGEVVGCPRGIIRTPTSPPVAGHWARRSLLNASTLPAVQLARWRTRCTGATLGPGRRAGSKMLPILRSAIFRGSFNSSSTGVLTINDPVTEEKRGLWIVSSSYRCPRSMVRAYVRMFWPREYPCTRRPAQLHLIQKKKYVSLLLTSFVDLDTFSFTHFGSLHRLVSWPVLNTEKWGDSRPF